MTASDRNGGKRRATPAAARAARQEMSRQGWMGYGVSQGIAPRNDPVMGHAWRGLDRGEAP